MVRPRRRGNRRLYLPGITSTPRLQRTRACGYSGSNPASALRSSPRPLPRHCVARPSSICFLCSSSCRLYLRVLFLSPTCESLHCASFIYLFVLRAFCLVVNRGRRGEERVSDSLAGWEDKRMDVVASS